MLLFHKLQKNSFIRASSIVFIGTMFVNAANYIFNLAMGRLLSPAQYGEVAALVTLSMLIAVPAGTLTTVMSKFTAHHDSQKHYQAAKALFTRFSRFSWLASGIIFAIMLVLAPLIARFFHTPLLPVLIFAGVLPISLVSAVNAGTLQGIKRFSQYVNVSIIGTIAKLILAIVFVLLGFSVPGVIAAILAGQLLSYAYSFFTVNKYYESTVSETEKSQPPSPVHLPVKLSSYIMLSFWTVLALSVLTNVDVILAKHFLSPELAGQYAALSVVGRIITYGSLAVVSVLFPSVASAKSKNSGEEHRLLAMGFSIVLLIASALVLIFNLFPELVVSLLFGSEYLLIVPYLGYFGIFMGLLALSQVLIQFFLATHNNVFIYPLVAIAFGEIVALFLYHGTIIQIIHVLLTTISILLFTLICIYFLTKTKTLPQLNPLKNSQI